MTEKIIIDTDPGIDDAFAIFYALCSSEIEVLGLTSVYGNASIDQTTHNALALVEMAGADCPVAKGAGGPLSIECRPYPAMVHGEDGMGGYSPQRIGRVPVAGDAVQFIIEAAKKHPREVTLVPIGPLTNIALALQAEPLLPQLIKRVILMGGAANANGNVTPAAEANIFDDPDAAELVFAADWDVVMLGLDATHDVKLTRDHVSALAENAGSMGRYLDQACEQYFSFHRDVVGLDFCHFHDPSALIYCVRPEYFAAQASTVRVVTEGFAAGKTIAKPISRFTAQQGWDNRARVDVCLSADGPAVVDHYMTVMSQRNRP